MADDTADYDFGEFADPSDETVAERSPLERAQRAVGWLELRLGITRELFQLSLSWLGEEALLTEALGVVESYTRTEASSAIMLDRFHNDISTSPPRPGRSGRTSNGTAWIAARASPAGAWRWAASCG